MRTAAMSARFSIVRRAPGGPAAGRSLLDERGDTSRPDGRRASRRAPARARAPRAARTPSTSARTGTPAAGAGRRSAGRSRARRASRSGSRERGGRPTHLIGQRLERRAERRRLPDDDERPARGRGLARRPISFAQAATHAIAVNGTPDLAAHGEAHTTRVDALAPENDRGRPDNVFAPLEERA